MYACFKLDIEQAHSQAFQWDGYLGGEGGTTGESRNVGGGGGGGGLNPPGGGGPGGQNPVKTRGKGEFGGV